MKLKTALQKYAMRITSAIIGISAVAFALLEPFLKLDSKIFVAVVLTLLFGIFITGILASNEYKYEWRYKE